MLYSVKSTGGIDTSEWCACAVIGKNKQEGKSFRKIWLRLSGADETNVLGSKRE
jgi:hypothetical protein